MGYHTHSITTRSSRRQPQRRNGPTGTGSAGRPAAGDAVASVEITDPPPVRTERRIIALRFTRRWDPHRIAFHLRMNRSTVEKVLKRFHMPLLANLDKVTGLPVRPARFEQSILAISFT
jgi:hypothetical protein